jgi:SAM-dependent methyltransferase
LDEALKTRIKRGPDFYNKYLTGKVIDIGAGGDLVVSYAERFDIEDGDANYITRYRSAESYDTVHSSHCLEHMFNPNQALNEWWRLIKPGGYLVIVVPDEDLYEQRIWPSIFNHDHKSTFRLHNNKSWSPVSYNIKDLISTLPDSTIISADLHNDYYDYSLQNKYPLKRKKNQFFILFAKKCIIRMPFVGKIISIKIENMLFKLSGYPIDQTMRKALAQIQIIALKSDKII